MTTTAVTSEVVAKILACDAPKITPRAIGGAVGTQTFDAWCATTDVDLLYDPSGAPVTVSLDRHFDLAADAIVHDARLGTIGLIHVVPEQRLAAWVRDRIDEAAYARHLLLTATRTAKASRLLAYTVEVVLCVSSTRPADAAAIGEALRDLYQRGTYLHGIGVTIWTADGDLQPVREGLPWLLGATREAFARMLRPAHAHTNGREAAGGTTAASEREDPSNFRSLSLTNFRIAGRRTLTLDADARVHLVHGPNGSGKSSLVEAFELLTTGRIVRLTDLDATPDYEKVLRNRLASEVAKIELDRSAWQVVRDGVDQPLDASLSGDSIRLNQDLADRLAAGSSGERAATFLRAFFPEEAERLTDRMHAFSELRSAWQAAPQLARQQLVDPKTTAGPDVPDLPEESRITSLLEWIAAPNVDRTRIKHIVDSSGAAGWSSWRAHLAPSAVAVLEETGELAWDDALAQSRSFDAGLASARDEVAANEPYLAVAIRVLEALAAEAGPRTARPPRTSAATLFDDWLRATAEADLAARLCDVAMTVQRATPPGRSVFSSDLRTVLGLLRDDPSSELLTTCTKKRGKLEALARDLRAQLTSSTQPSQRLPQAAGQPHVLTLQDADYAALDYVARRGLLGEELEHCDPPLGDAVRAVVERGGTTSVAGSGGALLSVGAVDWTVPLLDKLRVAQAVAGQIDAATERTVSLAATLESLQKLHDAAARVLATGAQAERDLSALLTQGPEGGGHLLAALNEVVALLTPARWGYVPLHAATDFRAGGTMELSAGDQVAIAQRLNTAELNIVALAFFILCARRVSNPLRLVVLDDPLQNMDEMTVTAVARALSKLMRLWRMVEAQNGAPASGVGEPWRLLILLHGQDDVERFRVELPCVLYRLPWLGTAIDTDRRPDEIIAAEPSLLSDRLQPLATVLSR